MPRMPRIHLEGALYYITSCGDHDQEIFRDNNDYLAYIDLLKKYKEQYGFKLFAYVLLSNHLHLLIELKEGITISQIMHDLNSSYIKYFNKRYNRSGHLFCERYRCVLIEKKPWLAPLTAYIHLNPIRKNVALKIEEYAFSSGLAYAQGDNTSGDLDLTEEINEVLACINMQSYSDFVRGFKKEELELLGNSLKYKQFLGSKEFKKKVKTAVEEYKKQAAEAEAEPVEQKNFILVGAITVVVLALIAGYLFKLNSGLKEKVNYTLHAKELEMETKIRKEREKITRSLKEKYAADQVSYEAMAKRVQREKEKIKKLENKLKDS